MSKPRRVLDCLLDVLTLQVGISFQDLLEGRPMGDLAHDDRNGNPHATDARPASHDLRIKCNAVEHPHHLLPCFCESLSWSGLFDGFPDVDGQPVQNKFENG